MEDELLTAAEVAQFLRVPLSWVYERCRAGAGGVFVPPPTTAYRSSARPARASAPSAPATRRRRRICASRSSRRCWRGSGSDTGSS